MSDQCSCIIDDESGEVVVYDWECQEPDHAPSQTE